MFTQNHLATAMTRLRFKDDTLLRSLGLAKLGQAFDAYPLVEEGRNRYFLLPKGMTTATVTGRDAAAKIIVLEKQGARLVKIWPAEGQAAAAPAEPAPRAQPEKADGDIEFVDE